MQTQKIFKWGRKYEGILSIRRKFYLYWEKKHSIPNRFNIYIQYNHNFNTKISSYIRKRGKSKSENSRIDKQ